MGAGRDSRPARGSVQAERVSMSHGQIRFARAQQIDVCQGGIALALSERVTLHQGGIAVAVADSVTVPDGSITVAVGSHIQGNVRYAVDVRVVAVLALLAGTMLWLHWRQVNTGRTP